MSFFLSKKQRVLLGKFLFYLPRMLVLEKRRLLVDCKS